MGGLTDFVENFGINTEALVARMPVILEGILVTVQLTVLGALGAMAIAMILGLAQSVKLAAVRIAARIVVEFFRGTSLVVQLFWFFFVLPLLGWQLDPLFCGVLALSLNYGAYGAEVVRGSVGSVPKGQYEAISALSLSPLRGMFRVIVPQAWALMIPSLSNLLIQLLKGTAIVSMITLHDLYFQVDQLRRTTGTWYAFGFGLLAYFVIAWVLVAFMNALEIRAKHRIGRGPSLRESLGQLFRSPGRKQIGGELA
ncbi:ectoine/hydroxyectoine ABC transporter permease subunit EhuC [Brachybacterium sp. YJGR34]|uniref:ectoine/hydroxyectoine ABC transporter permease subunit EhuC n=1 Tax=Brachybacterium sp. YJGR34 TaxID=2059911 RepID=UPI000E0A0566|nr:ectoine/hydroxyectoine ABC transporter permease subunit EhuC [Brachybacterium sp. YJGR34]